MAGDGEARQSDQAPVILIVDDQPGIREILKQLCTRAGYRPLLAANAVECYQQLADHPVSAIMLDIRMPKIDGIEALIEIRKNYSPTQLPIIMVTGLADEQDIVDALEYGANDYITKPINFAVTLARLRTQLQLSELATIEARAREIEAINALIVTYNHEINNPLMIADLALGNLSKGDPNDDDAELLEQASAAVERISEIVRKIGDLTKRELKKTSYLNEEMIKLD